MTIVVVFTLVEVDVLVVVDIMVGLALYVFIAVSHGVDVVRVVLVVFGQPSRADVDSLYLLALSLRNQPVLVIQARSVITDFYIYIYD